MSDVPVQLIVAAFQEEKGADEALKALKQAKRAGLVGIKDAAVLRRDAKDKIHIKDVRDVGGGKGSVAGGIFGAAIALLTGGTGIILSGAVGALVGGLAAKNIDMGLPNNRLKQLGDSLKPGTSAIVAIIEHRWVNDLEKALAEEGANVMTEALAADIAQHLEAGQDVAYTALEAEGAVAAGKVAAGEDSIEMSNIVATEDGIAAEATVITEEGAATKQIVVTEEGIVAAEAVLVAGDAAGDGEADKQS